MSNIKYIEFDSTFRDRVEYPIPSSFVVELSQSGQPTRENARAPVCNASPVQTWNSSFNNISPSGAIDITSIELQYSTSDPSLVILQNSGTGFRTTPGFYNGAVLQIQAVDGTVSRRRILSSTTYDLGAKMQVSLDGALSDSFTGISATSYIQDPTNNTTSSTPPKLFIPFGKDIDNYYNSMFVHNLNTGEYRAISGYDGTTHLAVLSATTTVNWSASAGAYNFAIRREIPIATGPIQYISSSVMQLSSTGTSNESDIYVSSYLRMGSPLPTGAMTGTFAPYGEERRISKYIAGDGTFTAIGGSTFTLSANSSNRDNYYTNAIITNVTVGESFPVLSYTGSSRSGIIDGTWGGGVAIGDVYAFRSAFFGPTFSVLPTVGQRYEIELFTKDGWNPFSYNGTLTTTQEMVCYEVELINLILPNRLLKSGRGGRIAFYPYIYVELQQVSASSAGSKYIINSNNPHAVKMTFRCAVDDTPTPFISPFIKIDGDGVTHTMKFKPTDSFRFSVRHASGELFQLVTQDTSPPTEPDPLVQISAEFCFKRVG